MNSTLRFEPQTILSKMRDVSDQQSWNEFVRCYTPRVFAWCKSHSLSDQQASVITQQILLQIVSVMRTIDQAPRRGTFRIWLNEVVTRTINTLFGDNESTKINPVFLPLLGENAIDSLTDQIETGYEAELLLAAESQAQTRLPSDSWAIYVQLTSNQKSAVQVAKELGIKVADVYIAKNKVIKVLRDIIRQFDQSS